MAGWHRVEAFLWSLLALFVGFFGNGYQSVPAILRDDPRVIRTAYVIANAAVVTNILLFLYTGIYLAKLKGISDAETKVPWVVPAGAASLAAAVLMYTVSLWPVFSILSPVIVFILAFGCMMSSSLLPNFGLLSVSSTANKRD